MQVPVGVLVENRSILLLRGNDSDLAGELQCALDHIVGDNVELLLLLALFKTQRKESSDKFDLLVGLCNT